MSKGLEAEDLQRLARAAWVKRGMIQRWTAFARLSWAWSVSELNAERDVASWAELLRVRFPGSAVLAGLHRDTDRIHAHVLLFLPKRVVGRDDPDSYIEMILEWTHGAVWLERFSSEQTVLSQHDAPQHGAADYLARFPDTVMQFGVAPAYVPRRKRSRGTAG